MLAIKEANMQASEIQGSKKVTKQEIIKASQKIGGMDATNKARRQIERTHAKKAGKQASNQIAGKKASQRSARKQASKKAMNKASKSQQCIPKRKQEIKQVNAKYFQLRKQASKQEKLHE